MERYKEFKDLKRKYLVNLEKIKELEKRKKQLQIEIALENQFKQLNGV